MQEFPLEKLGELYREIVLAHYRSSKNRARIESPDIEYDEFNPICGDQVVLQLRLHDGLIAEAGFHGQGCSISQASASMMAEALGGMSLEEAEQLSEVFRDMMYGRSPSPKEHGRLGDLQALLGVRKFPVRIKCALLAWTALEEGIHQYRGRTDKA